MESTRSSLFKSATCPVEFPFPQLGAVRRRAVVPLGPPGSFDAHRAQERATAQFAVIGDSRFEGGTLIARLLDDGEPNPDARTVDESRVPLCAAQGWVARPAVRGTAGAASAFEWEQSRQVESPTAAGAPAHPRRVSARVREAECR